MLKEVKDFDKTSLVPCSSASPSPRRSSLGSGKGSPLSNYDEGEGLRRRSFELKALKDDQVAKVLDGVFVGGIGGAKNKEELDKNGVTHVVNCSPVCHHVCHKEYEYLLVSVYDKSTDNIEDEFVKSNAFIRSALDQGGAVFVHCYAGQSRSVTLVVAWLIETGFTLEEALAKVRKARPSARPNSGFMEQLERFEKKIVARRRSLEETMFDMELDLVALDNNPQGGG
ncbi:dual specificity phosphatase [Chloropicon primus]|uniref:Dual specificity phosphatase n=1 Tax=Chloropicon primus TaxID=1764295 RepID=A0A5B8N1C4_9CHLO|nr:dual specificity phosphatase [Chloropicon primus]UPR04741.1 dual specificity phosphatase [Chloropicon primus]|eukprot:QDZ25544.1 dual specificity phosphatase [Chloropicon primus]